MTTEQLLTVLEKRGLTVAINAEGQPILRGDKSAASATLLSVLRLPCHRDEITRRFRPAPTRRIVLLRDGRDSEAVAVVWDGIAGQEQGRLRGVAEQHKGNLLAAEWLGQTPTGNPKWTRYLWCGWDVTDEIG